MYLNEFNNKMDKFVGCIELCIAWCIVHIDARMLYVKVLQTFKIIRGEV